MKLAVIEEQLKQINKTIVEIIESQKDNIDERHSEYSKYCSMYLKMFHIAYNELNSGQKKSCWMWFIFPNPKWESKLINGKSVEPSKDSQYWFIPDETGIPFLLYNINSDQILIRRLYAIMRLACKKLAPATYNRAVLFDYRFNEDRVSAKPRRVKAISGETLFNGDIDWQKFRTCVEFFLKAIAAMMDRFDLNLEQTTPHPIWSEQSQQIYRETINKYHKAVQKAKKMAVYHEFYFLLRHLYTRVTHNPSP